VENGRTIWFYTVRTGRQASLGPNLLANFQLADGTFMRKCSVNAGAVGIGGEISGRDNLIVNDLYFQFER